MDEWPWINPITVAAEWRGNQDVILHANRCIPTCLKAFEDAKPFSLEELKDWGVELESVGIEMEKVPKLRP